jgi:hypothetical protein
VISKLDWLLLNQEIVCSWWLIAALFAIAGAPRRHHAGDEGRRQDVTAALVYERLPAPGQKSFTRAARRSKADPFSPHPGPGTTLLSRHGA